MYYKTRSHFTNSDYRFIAQALGHSSQEQTAVMKLTDDPEILSELLHKEELFRFMISNARSMLSVTPSLYFYLMIYQALNFKHLADDDIADYISGICVDFTDNYSLWRYSTDVSERMIYFVDLERIVNDYKDVRQYHMHQYIGNAALFLTGFFPDTIYRREQSHGAPSLGYYESMGYTHFEAAANASYQYETDVTPVLFTLSEYFTEVRSAINLYADAYMNLHNAKGILERIERQSATLDEESFRQSLLL